MRFLFCEELHDGAAVEALARRYLGALEALVKHCVSGEAGGFTPSDFALAELDEAGLAAALEEFDFDD